MINKPLGKYSLEASSPLSSNKLESASLSIKLRILRDTINPSSLNQHFESARESAPCVPFYQQKDRSQEKTGLRDSYRL